MTDWIQLIIIPLGVAILGGIILLLFEYRTHWFANRRRTSNDSNIGGVRARGITSRQGNVTITESTGRGVNAENVNAARDVNISTTGVLNAAERIFGAMGFSAEQIFANGNITFQQILNSAIPMEQQLEFFRNQIGLGGTRVSNYANAQFESYWGVWKRLQSLKLAGDELWRETSAPNLVNFADELRKTKLVVNEGELFFEEQDRQELIRILKAFSEYRLGKSKVIDIRSQHKAQQIVDEFAYMLQNQIEENWQLKQEYERLLEHIRSSFRTRLSTM